VLEFLNIPDNASFRETDLEQAIIGKPEDLSVLSRLACLYMSNWHTAKFYLDNVKMKRHTSNMLEGSREKARAATGTARPTSPQGRRVPNRDAYH
jgi:hypothetical protein